MEKRLPNTCGLQLFRVNVKKSHILFGTLSAKKQKGIFLDIDGSTERFDPFFIEKIQISVNLAKKSR